MRTLLIAAVMSLCACASSEQNKDDEKIGTADQELSPETGDGVSFKQEVIAGIAVNTYSWLDSAGKTRTVSLKREGAGNSGHGGYAVQFTWEASGRIMRADGTQGGEAGFGFFVAHERSRDFDDGSSGTIAARHNEDDSPLGLTFPATSTRTTISATTTIATQTITSTYPKWGTVQAMADVDAQTSSSASAHKRFELPVTIRWVFQKGTDYPRIDISVDLAGTQPGQLSFDVRGPYGTMEFADADSSAVLQGVQWGDSAFHFTTKADVNVALTTAAAWSWNEPIGTSRHYNALLAARVSQSELFEIGLVEMPLNGEAGLVYGTWADTRGLDSVISGRLLLSTAFPDWQWPFQSAQYSGLSASSSVTFKKFAWGSSNLYGSANALAFLSDSLSLNLTPHPSTLTYRTCLVVGLSTYDTVNYRGLTRAEASAGASLCASANP